MICLLAILLWGLALFGLILFVNWYIGRFLDLGNEND